MSKQTIIQGHSGDIARRMGGLGILFDAVVCDPPYALGEIKDVNAMIGEWLAGRDGYEYMSGGFMNSSWEILPSPNHWRAIYDVMKPGAHLLAFAGTRTFDLMTLSLRLAGFEIRDSITVNGFKLDTALLGYYYGSGFPKSHDVSKGIDREAGAEREVVGNRVVHADQWTDKGRRRVAEGGGDYQQDIPTPATPEAAEWQGWGSALKPAHEPIIVARRPLERGLTIAANVLKHGTGAINIDATRVGSRADAPQQRLASERGKVRGRGGFYDNSTDVETTYTAGRWPSNLLFTHSPACEQVGERAVRGSGGIATHTAAAHNRGHSMGKFSGDWQTNRYGKEETVPAYACAPGCPVAELDRQSGNRPSGGSGNLHLNQWSAKGRAGIHTQTASSIQPSNGGASRFFATFAFQPLDFFPFLYTSKSSTSEREAGLAEFGAQLVGDGRAKAIDNAYQRGETERRNTHPTVKPLDLIGWVLKLVTPPGGIVADPFAGSGTTLVAAARLGIRAVGIELDPSYVAIARARLANAVAATTPTRNGGVVAAPRQSSRRRPIATLPMFATEEEG